jgi:hypothetical protein
LLEYADDATLLNPENAILSLEVEIAHIMEWATQNKMTVNIVKIKETIFISSILNLLFFLTR